MCAWCKDATNTVSVPRLVTFLPPFLKQGNSEMSAQRFSNKDNVDKALVIRSTMHNTCVRGAKMQPIQAITLIKSYPNL
jgi:hypothetical protein